MLFIILFVHGTQFGLIAGPYCTYFLFGIRGGGKKALMDICCSNGFCDGAVFWDWKPKLNLLQILLEFKSVLELS